MKSFMKSRILQALAPRARIARVIVAVAFAGLFTAACKDTSGPETLSTLTIVPPGPVTLARNATQPFTAAGTRSGTSVTLIAPVWAVVAGGGTINATTGVFTAGTVAGTFTNTVRVTCGGLTSFATVIVTPGALLRIDVTPNPVTLVIGAPQTFTAVGRDALVGGNVVSINPSWSVTAGGGTIPAGTTGLTAPFTAGNTTGTFSNTVRATQGTIFGTATVTVIAGPLFSITVTPNPDTTEVNTTQQFTAVGRDAGGNVVPIPPPLVWSVDNPPGGGSINASTGLFTAGAVTGTFTNAVRATSGAIFGRATVVVILPPAPPAVAGFTVLANAAVSCTNGSIIGEVGTFRALGDVPPGSITLSICPISGGTAQVGTPAAKTAFNNFVTTYNSLATVPCGVVLTGTLAGVNLPPGVYCFAAGASPTGTLTLTGTSTDRWLFKIGTGGTGALTPGLFTVTMAGGAQACNVTWWVRQAATMTDSFFKGSVLAGAGITLTRGSFNGNAWSQADVTITGPLTTAVTGCP